MIIRAPYPDYSAEAATYFAAMTVRPDASRKGLINTLIVGLKADGVWTGFDVFKIEAAHDAQAARLNAKNPSSNVSTLSNSPAFTTDRGYAGDGSTSYVNLGWVQLDGVQFAQNSASLGAYVNGGPNTASDALCTVGGIVTEGSILAVRSTASGLRGRINSGPSSDIAPGSITARAGLSVLNRSGASSGDGYKNGINVGSIAVTSSTKTYSLLYQGAAYNNGSVTSFSQDRVAIVFAGRSFTSTEHAAIYSRINTFLTAIGAN